jgi:hypothetical protein
MRYFLLGIICMSLASCATVDSNRREELPRGNKQNSNYQYNKYNLLDSPDGSKDPTAKIKIWGATY